MKTLTKFIFRVLALPFVAGVVLLATIRNYFYTLYLWLKGGGDLSVYDDVFNPESIRQQFMKSIKNDT